jgi:hypothetical protein
MEEQYNHRMKMYENTREDCIKAQEFSTTYAQIAVKYAFLVNAGGMSLLIPLAGISMWQTKIQYIFIASGIFGFGIIFAALCCFVAYYNWQLHGHFSVESHNSESLENPDKRKIEKLKRSVWKTYYAGIISGIASYMCFIGAVLYLIYWMSR